MMNKIRAYLERRKQKRFWDHPDDWLAYIDLDGDKVLAKVKGELAILERIPKPETGYHYKDIVKVTGPIGKKFFRDEKINEYKAIGIHKESGYLTFSFEAILPNDKDYFSLLESFKGTNQKVEFPWSGKEKCFEWRKGYCTAINIDVVKDILMKFKELGSERQIRNIVQCD
jgi:hypothetical protein